MAPAPRNSQAARQLRQKMWMSSPRALRLHLGQASQEPSARDTTGESTVAPHIGVLVQPLLVGLGAACLGFAAAMNVVVALSGGGFFARGARLEIVFWTALLGLLLVISLARAAQTSHYLYRWTEEQAARVATAQAETEHARLTSLQARISPPFLFGTLKTVAALARTDASRAERIVEHLSAFLRRTLERSSQSLTSLKDELQFTREYLDIEQERLGARLRVDIDVDPASVRLQRTDDVPAPAG